MRKRIYIITALFFMLINLTCSETEPEAPTVFHDVEQMTATKSGSDIITFYDVTSDVVVLVVGIFDGTEILVDADNRIVNTDWVGGNRTGLPNIDRSGATQYWTFNTVTKDFNSGIVASPNSGDVWAVWGYNSDWIVVCSTSKYTW
ncbi:MAG TPA: hypothetical protein PK293_14085 [Spirochaetota bacterium]|nr:hypothetical protein [Spirochaetota bacterium]HPF07164.1 hypothetical protein [Spirochaetota bacterium]HPJ41684.1 hypothetical protein [Spirochaetota bacterium]HPR37448.1 hypothetical protein [Spirochaetota bacterium]